MELKLIRETFTEKSTIGSLYVNGIFFCYTLEDKDRKLESGGVKEYAKTAIPRGKYKVITSFSNRFKKYMPEVQNVPQFAGIRIHAGNTADHSEGCILVGSTKGSEFIGNSRVTFEKLMNVIKRIEKVEKINITIE